LRRGPRFPRPSNKEEGGREGGREGRRERTVFLLNGIKKENNDDDDDDKSKDRLRFFPF